MSTSKPSTIPYEQRLGQDVTLALQEGSMHFEKESAVHATLRRIAKRLDELEIPYALAGGMALFFHGYRRFTEDVDVLVNPAGMEAIHRQIEGLGYVRLFPDSRALRDVESGVRIEFFVTGGYPGDGRPKPVSFPDPQKVSVVIEGIRILSLSTLVELKLASGMTNPARLQDLADVQRLIEQLALPDAFSENLDPYVRPKYHELWLSIHENPAQDA